MKLQANKLQDTLWESMHQTRLWFKAHRIAVLEHVQRKNPSCDPSMLWWIVLMAVEDISSVESIAAKNLQVQTTLVSQQCEAFEKLVATLTDAFDVRHVSDSEPEALGADDNSIVSDHGCLGVSVDSLHSLLDEIGTFVVDCIEALEAEEL